MSLPETIAVRYTEDEAEYVSLRPIVRQTFRMSELVDMIVSVTGKDVARIEQILKSGSVAYHGYRYWWQGFDAAASDVAGLLAALPVADASRKFDPAECTAIVFESGEKPPRHSIEISVAAASRRRFFHIRSFWDEVTTLPQSKAPEYMDYSYARRADIFVSAIAPGDAARLAEAAKRRLPRSMHARMAFLPKAVRVLWLCPRARDKSSG